MGGLCTVAPTDSDGDGLRDFLEYCYFGSNPFNANSDGLDEFPLSTPPGGPLVASCSDGREVANLNGDRTVNVADTALLASAVGGGLYGSPPAPGLEWKANMDMNQDGVINPADQGFLASKLGACP